LLHFPQLYQSVFVVGIDPVRFVALPDFLIIELRPFKVTGVVVVFGKLLIGRTGLGCQTPSCDETKKKQKDKRKSHGCQGLIVRSESKNAATCG
jgi:hypothetical protein